MSIKKQICVYPFDAQFSPVLRYKELLADLNIVSVVSPPGWGLAGKNAGIADGGGSLDYIVSSDFDAHLERCDSVLYVESINQIDFQSILLPRINRAIDAKKNILCMIPLGEESVAMIQNRCAQSSLLFKNYNKDNDFDYNHGKKAYGRFYINTPVIFVAGLSERAQKFHIQLSLRNNFMKLGYKVSMVGSRKYCEMLGFHSFPEFMFKRDQYESNKVILFNHFIKRIEIDEKPDVMIIGLPGGIDGQNHSARNDFGILSIEIAAAVKPDALVMSLQYNDYSLGYFKQLSDLCKQKFGINIDCFNIANIRTNYENAGLFVHQDYTTLHADFIDRWKYKFKKSDIPLFNMFNTDDAVKMTNCLVNKLSRKNDLGYEIV